MKTNIFFTALCLVAAGCTTEHLENVEDQTLVPVKVHVSDFSMSVNEFSNDGPITRTEKNVADYEQVGAITLAFYKGSTEAYKTTQVRSNTESYTTFGEFALSLPMGSYTMVVVGYGLYTGDVFTLTSPTSASFNPKARETFVKTQTVNITNSSGQDISATLDRIIAKLIVNSTDNKSADATSLKVTFSAGDKSFNPTTGLALANTGWTCPVTLSAGTDPIGIASFLFLTSDEQTVDITLETLNSDKETIYSKTISSVPLKRNRITTLSGPLFNASAAGAFKVNTDWETGNTVNF